MFKKQFTIPVLSNMENTHKVMRPTERWVFYVLTLLLILSALSIINKVYINASTVVPSSGGKIIEGVIGAPRFINPVLAISQTDKDLSNLIYAGLMTKDVNGNLIPELAKSYTVSKDAKKYTFKLHKGLTFHDGTPLTADDIIFTIEKAKQPDIKSPERAHWEGVAVQKVDDYTITFSLEKPYAQFLQNTLIGILPQEHLGDLTADEFIFSKFNTEPIGSGPYKFISSTHSNSGIPTKFILERFKKYVRGKPFIKKMEMNFYPNKDRLTEAMLKGDITSMSEVSPESVDSIVKSKSVSVITTTLPRIFAIFFNQNQNKILKNKYIREILRDVIDKDSLIQNSLNGYAQKVDSILIDKHDTTTTKPLSIKDAKNRLEKNGWKLDEESGFYKKDGETLSITLTTVNSTELKNIATTISNIWQNIGVQVKSEVFEPGDLAQNVLRTREFEALLFGTIVGTDPDPYAFWHSSQRNDPGLNIANYTNGSVDNLLVEARKTIDAEKRAGIYKKVATQINKDIPAIFLYAPSFIYIKDNNILGVQLPSNAEPSDRFNNIHLWHIKTTRTLRF